MNHDQGPQRTTFGLRIFQNLFPSVGHAGTWGPGANQLTSVHVEDVATAITAILKGLLDGKADEGKDGYCVYNILVEVKAVADCVAH